MNRSIVKVDKQHFLDYSDGGLLFYESILPDLRKRDSRSFENILNPFYDDTKPGLSIYEWDGMWRFRDHGHETYQGDVFCFAAHYYGLDVKSNFRQLLHKMYEEIGLEKLTIEIPIEQTLLDEGYKIPGDRFKDEYGLEKAYQYFKDYGISKDVLRRFGIRAIDKYEYINKTGEHKYGKCKNELTIAYESVNHVKLYQPNSTQFKFIIRGHKPLDFVFGQAEIVRDMWKTKKYLRDILIITGGEKDVLTVTSLGYDAICFNSETGGVPRQLEDSILNCYESIVVLYDIDDTGIKNSKNLEKKFGFKSCFLPEDLKAKGGKDVSDYMRLRMEIGLLKRVVKEAAQKKVMVWREADKLKDKILGLSSGYVNSKGVYIQYPDVAISEHEQRVGCEVAEGEWKEIPADVCNEGILVESEVIDLEDQAIIIDTENADLYSQLPLFFRQICDQFEDHREKEMLLLSALTVMSALFPKVNAINSGREVGCNFNLIISAPASSGKGVNTWAKELAVGVNRYLKERYELENQDYVENYRAYKREEIEDEPLKPVRKSVLIPANNSVSNIYKMLQANDGETGLIFETEIDTLSEVLNNDWGNFSDVIRKSFHHEPISMARRAGDELVEIDRPHLSIFLTGTPGQLFPLLHSVENGLFSRFTFYCLDASIEWRSQFNGVDNHLEKFFDRQAKKVLEMWIAQEGEGKSYVAFTKAQQERADEYFSKALGELSDLLGNEVGASVKRMCLIWQRIAMVLTATRSFEASAKMPSMLIVDDQDVEVAFSLTSLLLKHLKEVFASMSRHNVRSKLNENQRRLWELLPDRFARQEYDVTLKQIQIPKKTGEKYIKDFIAKGLLRRIKQGEYSKIR